MNILKKFLKTLFFEILNLKSTKTNAIRDLLIIALKQAYDFFFFLLFLNLILDQTPISSIKKN